MGNPAGVRRDFDALEKRRFQAIRLLERGENQSAIARQVKVVRQTVARWVQQYRAQGKSALWKAGRAGRKPHLGAARANPGFAIQLQLEESVGGRRADRVELLLSPVSRCREEGASAGLSASRGSTPASAAAGGVGPFAGAPQSTGSGLHRQSARLDSPRIPPSLRAGTEPRGIHLGSLEATRTAESLPQGLLPTQ